MIIETSGDEYPNNRNQSFHAYRPVIGSDTLGQICRRLVELQDTIHPVDEPDLFDYKPVLYTQDDPTTRQPAIELLRPEPVVMLSPLHHSFTDFYAQVEATEPALIGNELVSFVRVQTEVLDRFHIAIGLEPNIADVVRLQAQRVSIYDLATGHDSQNPHNKPYKATTRPLTTTVAEIDISLYPDLVEPYQTAVRPFLPFDAVIGRVIFQTGERSERAG